MYLFDQRPYLVRDGVSRHAPRRSAIAPDLWAALRRVKMSLDGLPRRERERRRTCESRTQPWPGG